MHAQVILIGDLQGLSGSGKSFRRHGWLDTGMEAGAMPVDARALLRVKVSDFDLKAVVRRLTR